MERIQEEQRTEDMESLQEAEVLVGEGSGPQFQMGPVQAEIREGQLLQARILLRHIQPYVEEEEVVSEGLRPSLDFCVAIPDEDNQKQTANLFDRDCRRWNGYSQGSPMDEPEGYPVHN